MEKKCKVVLLTADNKSNIHFDNIEINLTYTDIPVHYYNRMVESRHIYILSDDEIKERDWIYKYVPVGQKPYISEIHKVISIDKKEGIIEFEEHTVGIGFCKKIIATTNPDLIKEGIYSIDDEFIKEYCNNPVEEIIVNSDEYNIWYR